MTDEKNEEVIEDPFIATEKRLLQLEQTVSDLKNELNTKDKMMNAVIKTNKQLLTDLNNKPQPVVQKVNKDKQLEDSFFKHLGIKPEA